MAQSVVKYQATLMKDYYKNFSKFLRGKTPDSKIAWVTSFAPVEILEALGIAYYYPESYAAVIAASEKEQPMLEESGNQFLSCDCCSYSCCIEGCVQLQEGPRGVPPKPDVLIATNNQCSTLPNWWNILAQRYKVPLIVLDYPGERIDHDIAFKYVTEQHRQFISEMEKLSGNTLDPAKLEKLIQNSRNSINAWNRIVEIWPEHSVEPTSLFDDISFLITSRCKPETSQLYNMMADQIAELPANEKNGIPIFWTGYPLWYHPDRYLRPLMEGFRIVGSNYITWWSIDYAGDNFFEQLFNAYNYTFLNLSQNTRNQKLSGLIKKSGAICTITLHNKSCKCDFVSAKDIDLPQAEIEIDMIDRHFIDEKKTVQQLELLKETLCR